MWKFKWGGHVSRNLKALREPAGGYGAKETKITNAWRLECIWHDQGTARRSGCLGHSVGKSSGKGISNKAGILPVTFLFWGCQEPRAYEPWKLPFKKCFKIQPLPPFLSVGPQPGPASQVSCWPCLRHRGHFHQLGWGQKGLLAKTLAFRKHSCLHCVFILRLTDTENRLIIAREVGVRGLGEKGNCPQKQLV